MKNRHGGARRGAGRKPKAEREELTDRLSPYEDAGIEALISGVKRGEPWAVKLFFEYRWGKPKQRTDITSDGQQITPPPIVFYKPEPLELD